VPANGLQETTVSPQPLTYHAEKESGANLVETIPVTPDQLIEPVPAEEHTIDELQPEKALSMVSPPGESVQASPKVSKNRKKVKYG
jgi:hypothetical protein